jgi:hypothetical protein
MKGIPAHHPQEGVRPVSLPIQEITMNPLRSSPAVGTLALLAVLCAPGIAPAQSKDVEARTFACRKPEGCVHFGDLHAKSPAFRQALQKAARASGVRLDRSVFDGPSSPMKPVEIDGRRAVVGSNCEAHNCQHGLQVVYYQDKSRLAGLYADRDYRKHAIGDPTPAERRALAN